MLRRGRIAASAVLIFSLAACSSSHHGSAVGSADAQVRAIWSEFFNSLTPVAKRQQLLEDGAAFTSDLAAESTGGAISVSVGKVSVSDSAHATVSFSLSVAPSTHLPSVGGAAVRVDGKWLVSKSTMCAVLAATGRKSSACS